MGSLPLTPYTTLSNSNCRIVTLLTLLMSCLHGSALLTSLSDSGVKLSSPHYINSSVCYGVERTVKLDRLTTRTVTVRWTFNLIIAHIINLISQFYLLGINKKQFYFVDKCCNSTLF